MKKRDSIHSFQELVSSRFPQKPGAGAPAANAAPRRKTLNEPAAIADESALFLAAVSGTVDVSLKNPAPPVADSPEEEARPLAFGVAVPFQVEKNTAIPDTMQNKKTASLSQSKTASSVQPPARPVSQEEKNLFLNAMDGVAPIRAGGRDLAPPAISRERTKDAETALLDDLFSANLEFSLEYTDEFVHGHVLGTDPVVLGKLRAGAYSPEGHIDLHGQNLEQAYASLNAFIKSAYQSGKRHVLIITGRGKNSPGGTPVLRERVQAWFTRDPFKRVVLAFCTAKPGDGGAGALYMLLRRRKKSQGKIVWDRVPSEEELLL